MLGPQLPPEEATSAAVAQLPDSKSVELKGHDGPIFAVRFNKSGSYCLSCGKVGRDPQNRLLSGPPCCLPPQQSGRGDLFACQAV